MKLNYRFALFLLQGGDDETLSPIINRINFPPPNIFFHTKLVVRDIQAEYNVDFYIQDLKIVSFSYSLCFSTGQHLIGCKR
jgi:hypothetical protein